ncbi:MAG: hypothetical protein IJV64_02925 [Oscillospiraceae bacterium]|nr:hypothetical protein [Oscillospiraceae bacterium]
MPKRTALIALALTLVLMLTACTGTSMAYTFNVETGEEIEVRFNTTGGYQFTQSGGDMFLKDRSGSVILTGYFLLPETYEVFTQEPGLKDGATESGDKYQYDVDAAGTVVFLAKAPNAKAGILFYSGEAADMDNCISVFERLSFAAK